MNDKLKKIIYYIIAVVLTSLLLCSGISAIYFGVKYHTANESLQSYIRQSELARERAEQYESFYRESENTNRELRTVISDAARTNREMGECLSRSSSTLSELRRQIEAVAISYTKMENILNSVGNNNSNIGDNNNSVNSGDGE